MDKENELQHGPVHLADVRAVLSVALECAFGRRLIGECLKMAGRDRVRRQAMRETFMQRLEAIDAFERRPTPVTWARLVKATHQVAALIKAKRRRQGRKT